MSEGFAVRVGSGTRRDDDAPVTMRHAWTERGVSVDVAFTGAHLLHLAAAGCVLNDVHREAAALGVPVTGVQVVARWGFDTDTWAPTGITYVVRVDGPVGDDLAALLARVDEVAEIPRTIRAGATVRRHGRPAAEPLSHRVRCRRRSARW